MADLQKIVDDLSGLTVLEAAELAKLLEEKWGVSAAAAVAVAGPATAAAAPAEKKTEFPAILLDDAGKKIVFSPCMDCPEDKAAGRSVCGSFDRLEVTLGAIHGDQVEVHNGLQPGMEVVTTGQYQLKTALGSGQLKAGCCDH